MIHVVEHVEIMLGHFVVEWTIIGRPVVYVVPIEGAVGRNPCSMVVHHVKDNRDAHFVTGIHQLLEHILWTVELVYGEIMIGIVSPRW